MSTIKILCFAILGMIVGNAECALPPAGPVAGTNVLDFDTIANIRDNIPAMFQPKIYQPAGYNVAGPNNLRYVYFTVINNAPGAVPPAPANFHAAQMVAPNPANEHNIYFPADGSQPTTPEAVEYSCANVEDDAITEWYMKMFGVIDRNCERSDDDNDYIKAGWSATEAGGPVTQQRIISFDDSMLYKGFCGLYKCDHRKTFCVLFRKIASNPAGRILLYRLLIEIRRRDRSYSGTPDNNITVRENAIHTPAISSDGKSIMKASPSPKDMRNSLRTIIVKNKKSFDFSNMEKYIAVDLNSSQTVPTVVEDTENNLCTDFRSRDNSIALYHELLHWFHYLRDYERANAESLSDDGKELFKFFVVGHVGAGVFKNTPIEEIRTMLGCHHDFIGFQRQRITGFLNGDDLSENLYRCVLKSKDKNALSSMRYGYSCKSQYSYELALGILLAHQVVTSIAMAIINDVSSWKLQAGEAVSL